MNCCRCLPAMESRSEILCKDCMNLKFRLMKLMKRCGDSIFVKHYLAPIKHLTDLRTIWNHFNRDTESSNSTATLTIYDNSYQYMLGDLVPSSYNLPELVKKEIDALVKAGYYSSKSDVVKDALRTFLYSKKNLRVAAAVELYKDGAV